MAIIPLSEAQSTLDELVREIAASGACYVITVNGRPMAELRPFVPVPTPGRYKDAIRFTEDAFSPLSVGESEDSGD